MNADIDLLTAAHHEDRIATRSEFHCLCHCLPFCLKFAIYCARLHVVCLLLLTSLIALKFSIYCQIFSVAHHSSTHHSGCHASAGVAGRVLKFSLS